MEQDLVTQGLLSQGMELTLFGMGTVVVFLTLLVFVTSGMSALVARFFPSPPAPPPARQAPAEVADARLLTVISAALHQHRNKQQRSTSKQDHTQ